MNLVLGCSCSFCRSVGLPNTWLSARRCCIVEGGFHFWGRRPPKTHQVDSCRANTGHSARSHSQGALIPRARANPRFVPWRALRHLCFWRTFDVSLNEQRGNFGPGKSLSILGSVCSFGGCATLLRLRASLWGSADLLLFILQIVDR